MSGNLCLDNLDLIVIEYTFLVDICLSFIHLILKRWQKLARAFLVVVNIVGKQHSDESRWPQACHLEADKSHCKVNSSYRKVSTFHNESFLTKLLFIFRLMPVTFPCASSWGKI